MFVICVRQHPAPHLLLVHEPVLVEVALLPKLLLPLLPITLQGTFTKHCLHVLGQIEKSVTIQVVILEIVVVPTLNDQKKSSQWILDLNLDCLVNEYVGHVFSSLRV